MKAQNRLLKDWFPMVARGQIVLPRFQRFEAWGHGQVAGLLESVLSQLPIGATLILEVGEKEQFLSRPLESAPEGDGRPVEHLLDGQQRLTALWRSLRDTYENRTYLVREEQETDGEAMVWRVYSQARWDKGGRLHPLWVDDPMGVHERGFIPARLLRPGDLGDEIYDWCDAAVGDDSRASRNLLKRVTALRERVSTYNIPYLALPPTTPKHVALDVFIKMNTSSVRLSAFDIVVAEVEAHTGESLHQLVRSLEKEVPAIGHYMPAKDLVLQTAALRADKPPTQKSYHQLDYGRLVAEWDALVEGARFAIKQLEANRIFDRARLPTLSVLAVLAALNEHVPHALDARGNAVALLRRYIWRAFCTGRYESAAATRAVQDYRGLRAQLTGIAGVDIPVFDDEIYPLPSTDDLIRASWPKSRDVLARTILAVSLLGGARDFADDALVGREHLAQREYHHLFPDAFLTRADMGALPTSHSYRALNCALITWNTNRNISAKEPLAYLRERTNASQRGESEIRARLASHLVPFDELAVEAPMTLTPEERRTRIQGDYKRFLEARAKRMVEVLRILCEGRAWPQAAE